MPINYGNETNIFSGIKFQAAELTQHRILSLQQNKHKINVKRLQNCTYYVQQFLQYNVYFRFKVSITQACLQVTPSPWLTQIHFLRISLTRIFKKFPFLT